MNSSKDLIPYRKGNLWGYCDRKGDIVLEPKYGFASPFTYGLAFFAYPNEEKGFFGFSLGILSNNFEELISPDDSSFYITHGKSFYSGIDFYFGEKGFSLVSGLRYRIAENSKSVVEFSKLKIKEKEEVKFLEVFKLEDDIYLGDPELFTEKVNLFLFDGKGNQVDPIYLNKGVLKEVGVYLTLLRIEFGYLRINGKYGVVDFEGVTVIPFIYDQMSPFRMGISHVVFGGKDFLINEKGEILNPFFTNRIWFDKEMRCWIAEGESNFSYFSYDPYGRIIKFESGKHEVFPNGKKINVKKFDAKNEFVKEYLGGKKSKGVAVWFLINLEGSILVPYDIGDTKLFFDFAIYDSRENFYNEKKSFGVVDVDNSILLPNRYKKIDYLGNGDFLVEELEYSGIPRFSIISWNNQLKKIFSQGELMAGVIDPYQYYSFLDIIIDFERSLLVILIKNKNDELFHLAYSSFGGDVFSEGEFSLEFERGNYTEYYDNSRYYDDGDFYSDNPWDDVFGPGDESDDALWNTRGE
ncbi:MAG: WG repeat-containing protein [Cytophagia bacterium]|nr:WG repeat-containing protein [Cytophagia bacterium]